MSQMYMSQYSSARAFTPSDTERVTCRGISCNTAGNLVLDLGSGDVTFAAAANQIYPIALTQGLVRVSSTAAGIILWS